MTLTLAGIIILVVLSVTFVRMALPNIGGFILSALIVVLGIAAAVSYANYKSTVTGIEQSQAHAVANASPDAPYGYIEVAEDGSADHYLDWGGNIEHDLRWPAGTFKATGQWYTCWDLEPVHTPNCREGLSTPGATVVTE